MEVVKGGVPRWKSQFRAISKACWAWNDVLASRKFLRTHRPSSRRAMQALADNPWFEAGSGEKGGKML